MSQNAVSESEKARQETVEVLLSELERAMDKQFEAIDALDSKAGIIFGAASLVSALMTVAQGAFFQKMREATTIPSWFSLVGFGLAIVLYVAIVCCLIRAFRIMTYYLPMKIDREHIQAIYLPLTKAEVKEQLVANYIEHSQTNWAILEDKARWVQKGLYLLGIDIIFLTIFIAVGTMMGS